MFVEVDRYGPFELDPEFLAGYRQRPVQWGFGALSWVTYKRTYSRDGEDWWQTCQRVIEGMFTVQRVHLGELGLPWDEARARHDAEAAYDRMWHFKWTPPGRGLWIMGTRHVYERGGAALNNCGFVSTRSIAQGYAEPFAWTMSMLMFGVGVGFDTRGKGTVTIRPPLRSPETHVVADTREGWVEALRRLLSSYVGQGTLPAAWDYSRIRPQFTPLKSFGGLASGPAPLCKMLDSLTRLYDTHAGQKVDARLIVDTMNLIGCCVVAGGIRRSAEIAFGDPDDAQFMDLKLDPEKVLEYRWASNNSVFAAVGMDYADVARRTAVNGEPGYFWLDSARAYGRMKDAPTWADDAAEGSNPCVEQTLWDRELCCLVETFPARHDDLEDFKETLRLAYQYAKTVTLVPTHDPRTNAVMLRNRRIGCSMTGITQAIHKLGDRTFLQWCDDGYAYVQRLDEEYAKCFRVPRSIKTTSVKPSGSVSLLAGATPGVHWEHAPYYLRRMRVAGGHPLIELARRAGYPVEPDVYADNTLVISFPVHVPYLDRRKSDVSLREKVDLAAQLQHYWSDNQVSCTADFDPTTEAAQIPQVLAAYEDRLKAIVFMPATRHGYPQAPYEEITRERYEELISRLTPLEGPLGHEPAVSFCDGARCEPL
jgi:ribonucleoside-triphosphate reductase